MVLVAVGPQTVFLNGPRSGIFTSSPPMTLPWVLDGPPAFVWSICSYFSEMAKCSVENFPSTV